MANKTNKSILKRTLQKANLAKEIIFRVTTRPKTPDHVILYVTSRCGAKCNFCFYSAELNKKEEKLDLSVIEKLTKDLGHLEGLALTGGDPFLRHELAEISEMFEKNCKVKAIHIPSNGVNPIWHEKQMRRVLEKTSCEVTCAFSLDATKEIYESIRGIPNNFALMMDTYDRMVKLKEEFGDRFHLVVNTVITKITMPKFPELAQHVKERMPMIELHDFDLVRNRYSEYHPMLPELQQLKDAKKMFYAHFDQYSNTSFSGTLKKMQYDLNLRTLEENRQVLPCVAANTFAVISELGDVRFCEMREVLGNINKENIVDIWNGEKAMKVKASIERGDCACTHGCFQPLNILYNPKTYPELLSRTITKK